MVVYNHSMNFLSRHFGHVSSIALLLLLDVQSAFAQKFGGGDVQSGLPVANGVNTGSASNDVRTSVIGILGEVLGYVALTAVVVVIIAGIYLVVGFGSEDSQQRARKIILYTIIGLIVILAARGLVNLAIDGSLAN